MLTSRSRVYFLSEICCKIPTSTPVRRPTCQSTNPGGCQIQRENSLNSQHSWQRIHFKAIKLAAAAWIGVLFVCCQMQGFVAIPSVLVHLLDSVPWVFVPFCKVWRYFVVFCGVMLCFMPFCVLCIIASECWVPAAVGVHHPAWHRRHAGTNW